MKRFAPFAAVVVFVFVFGAAGCGSSTAKVSSNAGTTKSTTATTESTNDANSSATTAASVGPGPAIEVKESSFGKIITNGSGVTLYLFTPDTATSSACTGGCASAWPPVAAATNGSGVDADDLGTITRPDGTKQATFYGHPLYTYSGDSAPGDVNGQGTGGKWYVINSEGEAVKVSGATPTTAAATPTTDDDSGY